MFDKILGLLGFHVTQWETIIIVKTVQDQNSELWFTGSEHPSCKTLTNWELHPPPRKHFSPEEYTCIHCSSILFPSLIFFQTIQSCFFRTLFTGIERYTFVDPDYAFTDEEELHRVEHKQKYLDYIATLRQKRQADKKRRYTTTNIVVFQLKPETSFNCSI